MVNTRRDYNNVVICGNLLSIKNKVRGNDLLSTVIKVEMYNGSDRYVYTFQSLTKIDSIKGELLLRKENSTNVPVLIKGEYDEGIMVKEEITGEKIAFNRYRLKSIEFLSTPKPQSIRSEIAGFINSIGELKEGLAPVEFYFKSYEKQENKSKMKNVSDFSYTGWSKLHHLYVGEDIYEALKNEYEKTYLVLNVIPERLSEEKTTEIAETIGEEVKFNKFDSITEHLIILGGSIRKNEPEIEEADIATALSKYEAKLEPEVKKGFGTMKVSKSNKPNRSDAVEDEDMPF